jgi:glycosyltransferase involved in cell wall biosynthesis
MRQKKAAIVFYEGYISVQPSVINAAAGFARHGYEVDLFYRRPTIAVLPPAALAGVRLWECNPKPLGLLRFLRRWRRARVETPSKGSDGDGVSDGGAAAESHGGGAKSAFRDWLGSIEPLWDLFQFGWFCRRHMRGPSVIVSFDMTGLAAVRVAASPATPVVYWSLEPMTSSEVRGKYARLLKNNEMARLPRAAAVVVQGPERAQLLTRDIPLRPEQIVTVPNGPADIDAARVSHAFFTERFDVPSSKLVVLSAGAIQENVGSLDFARVAATWSDRFVLALHERAKRSPEEPFIRELRRVGGERILLSLDPVPFEQVAEVYASAHIGLIYYEPMNVNYATGAHASGKLSYYLQHGLPVVAMGAGCPQFILDYRCGIAVERPEQIEAALVEIADAYDEYSENARRCWRELFDVDRAVDRLIDHVERVGSLSQ